MAHLTPPLLVAVFADPHRRPATPSSTRRRSAPICIADNPPLATSGAASNHTASQPTSTVRLC